MLRHLFAALVAITLCSVSPGLLAAPNANASAIAKDKSSQNNGKEKPAKPEKPVKPDKHIPDLTESLPATDGDAAQALDEVTANGSIELKAVLEAVAAISDGRMLEIEPRRVGGRLYYDVTVMETAGVIRHILVDARTGNARSLR